MYFPQEGCSLFCPKKAGHFLPQEGKKELFTPRGKKENK